MEWWFVLETTFQGHGYQSQDDRQPQFMLPPGLRLMGREGGLGTQRNEVDKLYRVRLG